MWAAVRSGTCHDSIKRWVNHTISSEQAFIQNLRLICLRCTVALCLYCVRQCLVLANLQGIRVIQTYRYTHRYINWLLYAFAHLHQCIIIMKHVTTCMYNHNCFLKIQAQDSISSSRILQLTFTLDQLLFFCCQGHWDSKSTVNAQIFVTIFCGLNFRGDKFFVGGGSQRKFSPHKKLLILLVRNGAE